VRVQGSGESAAKILRRPVPSHLLVVPPAPGTFGVWQVRRVRHAPLGYVLSRSEHGVCVYHCYARSHGRDPGGGWPWLRRTESLNSAVAWMIPHEAELFALTKTLTPEPEGGRYERESRRRRDLICATPPHGRHHRCGDHDRGAGGTPADAIAQACGIVPEGHALTSIAPYRPTPPCAP
jgi:hypothetical protein